MPPLRFFLNLGLAIRALSSVKIIHELAYDALGISDLWRNRIPSQPAAQGEHAAGRPRCCYLKKASTLATSSKGMQTSL
jgi:hypothetical protein